MPCLHAIDHFTRLSAGSIVIAKKPREFVKHFIHCWLSVHGPPRRLFSDSGGEFNSEEMRNMAQSFSIDVKTTVACSPWSSGLSERHHQTLTEILMKVKRDSGCGPTLSPDGKNCKHKMHGYSSHQLIFAQNPNLPLVPTDQPPA